MKYKKFLAILLAATIILSSSAVMVNAALIRDEHTNSGNVLGCESISRITFNVGTGRLVGYSRLATDGSAEFSDFLAKTVVVCNIYYDNNDHTYDSASNEAYMYYNEGNDPSYDCVVSCEAMANMNQDIDYITTEHSYYVNGVHQYTYEHYKEAGTHF